MGGMINAYEADVLWSAPDSSAARTMYQKSARGPGGDQVRPAIPAGSKFGLFVSDEIEFFSSHAPRTVHADLTLKL